MFHRVKLVAAVAFFAVAIFPHIAKAQTGLDTKFASAAFNTAKETGVTPTTKGEYIMCAALWGTMDSALSNGEITAAQAQALPQPDFYPGIPGVWVTDYIKKAKGASNFSERFQETSNNSRMLLIEALQGNAEKTKMLFGALGSCSPKTN